MLELEHGFRVVVDVDAAAAGGRRQQGALEPNDHGRSTRAGDASGGDHRIDRLPPSRSGTSYIAPNNGVARRSVDRPFVAVARINGSQTPGRNATGRLRNAVSRREDRHTSPSDIEKYAYDDRFHGFVLDPAIDDYPDDDVLAALEDVDLPVIVRGGVDAPRNARRDPPRALVPRRRRPLRRPPLNRSLMSEMIDLLDEYDDCYLETSFVRYREQLERALREHPDRVFFGSGAPACHPNVAVMEILTLDVSEDLCCGARSRRTPAA